MKVITGRASVPDCSLKGEAKQRKRSGRAMGYVEVGGGVYVGEE